MKHFQQRNSSLTKYYMIIFFFCILDIYQIVMTFTVSLASLVRLKAIEERVEGYMKVSQKQEVNKGVGSRSLQTVATLEDEVDR